MQQSESLDGSARKTHNASLTLYDFLFILPEQLVNDTNIFNLPCGAKLPLSRKGRLHISNRSCKLGTTRRTLILTSRSFFKVAASYSSNYCKLCISLGCFVRWDIRDGCSTGQENTIDRKNSRISVSQCTFYKTYFCCNTHPFIITGTLRDSSASGHQKKIASPPMIASCFSAFSAPMNLMIERRQCFTNHFDAAGYKLHITKSVEIHNWY